MEKLDLEFQIHARFHDICRCPNRVETHTSVPWSEKRKTTRPVGAGVRSGARCKMIVSESESISIKQHTHGSIRFQIQLKEMNNDQKILDLQKQMVAVSYLNDTEDSGSS